MTNDELKKKIVEIMSKVWEEPVPCTAERKFECISDALIAAGIGDVAFANKQCAEATERYFEISRKYADVLKKLDKLEKIVNSVFHDGGKEMAKTIFKDMYAIVRDSSDETIVVTADDVVKIAKKYGVTLRR